MLHPRAAARTRRRRRAHTRRGSGRAAGPAASRRRHGEPALRAARRRCACARPRGRARRGRRGPGRRRRGSALGAVAAQRLLAPAAAAALRCSARRARSPRCSRCAACAMPSRACARRSRPAIWRPRAHARRATSSAATPRSSIASELAGAAIQSLAENLSDSVVAPLLAYAAGGLPAAAAYRALNTADAMWGYRTPELLHRGRAAARADDLANLIPARADRALHRGALAAARRGAAGRAARPRAGALPERRLADGGDGRRPRRAPGQARLLLVQRRCARARTRPTSAARWRSSVGKALMVQGCTSHAGKSYLTAALCRLLADDGLRVAPFKAQNMSNNAGVTADGREIGRAQIVQAAAARIAPEARMNPVLVKPEADTRSQVVVLGEADREISRLPWRERRARLWPVVARVAARAARRLRRRRDRGRGQPGRDQPARRRHRQHGASRSRSRRPVLLCCDIDRGGAFAHLLGTWHCLAEPRARPARGLPAQPLPRRRVAARARARRGSRSAPACRRSASSRGSNGRCPRRTASRSRAPGAATGRIAIVALPRIANLDEFAPLGAARALRPQRRPRSRRAAVIVIPGTKTRWPTSSWLRTTGLAGRSSRRAEPACRCSASAAGCRCSARSVRDPHAVEGGGEAPGLGLLDLVTELQPGKTTRLVRVTDARRARSSTATRSTTARRRGSDARLHAERAGRPARLAYRQRAGELRARPAGARGLPRRAARWAGIAPVATPEGLDARLSAIAGACARPSTGRASAPSSDSRPDSCGRVP